MDPALKQRLIGALVLVALAVIFLPMLLDGPDGGDPIADVPLDMPAAPDRQMQTRELPLVVPAPAPAGGALGMPDPAMTDDPNRVATVDASSSIAPRTDALSMAPTQIGPDTMPAVPSPVAEPDGADQAGADQAGAEQAGSEQAAPAAPAAAAPAASAPTSVATSEPLPASQAGGQYVVNAGVYSNVANANKLVAALQAAGLRAYGENSMLGGKPAMRVRIGPFEQRAQAESARQDALRARSGLSANVIALDAAAPMPAAATVAAPRPVAATPASAPPASAANAGFAVQVGAFRDEGAANARRDTIRAAGFSAFVQRVSAEGGTLYRVRVGPSADRAGADRMRAELSRTLQLDGNVVSHP